MSHPISNAPAIELTPIHPQPLQPLVDRATQLYFKCIDGSKIQGNAPAFRLLIHKTVSGVIGVERIGHVFRHCLYHTNEKIEIVRCVGQIENEWTVFSRGNNQWYTESTTLLFSEEELKTLDSTSRPYREKDQLRRLPFYPYFPKLPLSREQQQFYYCVFSKDGSSFSESLDLMRRQGQVSFGNIIEACITGNTQPLSKDEWVRYQAFMNAFLDVDVLSRSTPPIDPNLPMPTIGVVYDYLIESMRVCLDRDIAAGKLRTICNTDRNRPIGQRNVDQALQDRGELIRACLSHIFNSPQDVEQTLQQNGFQGVYYELSRYVLPELMRSTEPGFVEFPPGEYQAILLENRGRMNGELSLVLRYLDQHLFLCDIIEKSPIDAGRKTTLLQTLGDDARRAVWDNDGLVHILASLTAAPCHQSTLCSALGTRHLKALIKDKEELGNVLECISREQDGQLCVMELIRVLGDTHLKTTIFQNPTHFCFILQQEPPSRWIHWQRFVFSYNRDEIKAVLEQLRWGIFYQFFRQFSRERLVSTITNSVDLLKTEPSLNGKQALIDLLKDCFRAQIRTGPLLLQALLAAQGMESELLKTLSYEELDTVIPNVPVLADLLYQSRLHGYHLLNVLREFVKRRISDEHDLNAFLSKMNDLINPQNRLALLNQIFGFENHAGIANWVLHKTQLLVVGAKFFQGQQAELLNKFSQNSLSKMIERRDDFLRVLKALDRVETSAIFREFSPSNEICCSVHFLQEFSSSPVRQAAIIGQRQMVAWIEKVQDCAALVSLLKSVHSTNQPLILECVKKNLTEIVPIYQLGSVLKPLDPSHWLVFLLAQNGAVFSPITKNPEGLISILTTLGTPGLKRTLFQIIFQDEKLKGYLKNSIRDAMTLNSVLPFLFPRYKIKKAGAQAEEEWGRLSQDTTSGFTHLLHVCEPQREALFLVSGSWEERRDILKDLRNILSCFQVTSPDNTEISEVAEIMNISSVIGLGGTIQNVVAPLFYLWTKEELKIIISNGEGLALLLAGAFCGYPKSLFTLLKESDVSGMVQNFTELLNVLKSMGPKNVKTGNRNLGDRRTLDEIRADYKDFFNIMGSTVDGLIGENGKELLPLLLDDSIALFDDWQNCPPSILSAVANYDALESSLSMLNQESHHLRLIDFFWTRADETIKKEGLSKTLPTILKYFPDAQTLGKYYPPKRILLRNEMVIRVLIDLFENYIEDQKSRKFLETDIAEKKVNHVRNMLFFLKSILEEVTHKSQTFIIERLHRRLNQLKSANKVMEKKSKNHSPLKSSQLDEVISQAQQLVPNNDIVDCMGSFRQSQDHLIALTEEHIQELEIRCRSFSTSEPKMEQTKIKVLKELLEHLKKENTSLFVVKDEDQKDAFKGAFSVTEALVKAANEQALSSTHLTSSQYKPSGNSKRINKKDPLDLFPIEIQPGNETPPSIPNSPTIISRGGSSSPSPSKAESTSSTHSRSEALTPPSEEDVKIIRSINQASLPTQSSLVEEK